jgi:hypothetical protein
MQKKIGALIGGTVTITVVATLLVLMVIQLPAFPLFFNGSVGTSFSVGSIHATITMTKSGEKVFEQYHAGVLTQLGMNYTMGRLTGNASYYNMTTYPTTASNITYVSIGNAGSLSSAITVLPGEWNRTTALQHDGLYNSCNFTAVFHPGTGPYTADCIGLNFYSATIGEAYTLWGYDTFTEVTGIDDTFVITIEFKITVS